MARVGRIVAGAAKSPWRWSKLIGFGHAWVVSAVRAADGPTDAVPLDPEQRVRDLLKIGDVRAAREVIEEALRTPQNRSELLWVLADVEFADGDQQAGARCLTEAVSASGGGAAAISRQIDALSENRLWREALRAVEHVPAQVRDDPLVRTAVGDFYKARGCHAHAADGYGDSAGLSSSARAKRRLSRLRAGGPFKFARRRVNAWEDSDILPELRRGRRASVQLDAVPDLDSREAQRLKVRMENANYEWSYRNELVEAIGRWELRLLPAAWLPVWLVLYLIVSSTSFLSGAPGVVGGTAISAAIALGVPILVLRSLMRSDLTLRVSFYLTLTWFSFLLVLAILAEIAVAEGYDHHVLPMAGWWAWVVFGLVVLPAVSACMLVSAAIEAVLASRWILSARREHCQVHLLDLLSSMLLDMQSPSRQLDLGQRLQWSWQLELAARWISRDLLSSVYLSHIASGDWLRRRAAGWAEALRYMQREILTPVPGRWPKLEARLRHEIRCLATGDLGALAWRQPTPSTSRRTSLARKTIEILRTVLVAALPLAAVLVGQAVLHFSTGVFRWTSIATGSLGIVVRGHYSRSGDPRQDRYRAQPSRYDSRGTKGQLTRFTASRTVRLPPRHPLRPSPPPSSLSFSNHDIIRRPLAAAGQVQQRAASGYLDEVLSSVELPQVKRWSRVQ